MMFGAFLYTFVGVGMVAKALKALERGQDTEAIMLTIVAAALFLGGIVGLYLADIYQAILDKKK